jgi:2-keto-4-pentenoate hydratase
VSEERARRAAEAIWLAWLRRRRLESLPGDCRPETLADGYAAQRALGAFAGPAVGWKLAATSEAGQRHINVGGPLAGRLYGRFLHDAPAVLPAAHLSLRVAEAEFAFRIGSDLPPRPGGYSVEETMGAVAALHVAIEVPDCRFADVTAAGMAQLAADDACAGYFVLGPEAEGWRELDLSVHPVSFSRNGTVGVTGSGGNVLGDPRVALAWLASHEHAEGLVAGEIVTTGTSTEPLPIVPGDVVEADFGALGSLQVEFEG